MQAKASPPNYESMVAREEFTDNRIEIFPYAICSQNGRATRAARHDSCNTTGWLVRLPSFWAVGGATQLLIYGSKSGKSTVIGAWSEMPSGIELLRSRMVIGK